jgi:putative hydrolase of the HAD superfamily
MIKNIIFDYGAVIFDIDHQLTIQAFKDIGLQAENDFFGHLAQNPIFDLFEKGKMSAVEFRNSIRKLIPAPLTDQTIDEAWNKMLLGIPSGNLETLLLAKNNYRTFLLSNNNAIHYDWILKYLLAEFQLVNGMADYFEKDYYSHLMGMRKPNADIFEFVLQAHGLNESETLFIDDSPQHIATAKQLGLHTHLMLKEDHLLDIVTNAHHINS